MIATRGPAGGVAFRSFVGGTPLGAVSPVGLDAARRPGAFPTDIAGSLGLLLGGGPLGGIGRPAMVALGL